MKKDLGKSYGETAVIGGSDSKNEKYYPSTNLESEDGLDVPDSMMNKDIDVRMTVRIVRKSTNVDKKGTKQSLELEFRKIDFGQAIKDKDLQDDIADAVEQTNESKADEKGEED